MATKKTLVTNGAAVIETSADATVKLSWHDIEADKKFNARHALEEGSLEGKKAEEQEGNFIGLCLSIAREGQKTPVVVRPNPAYGKDKNAKPYLLCSGFQRHAAIGVIRIQAGGEDTVREVNQALEKALGHQTRASLLNGKPEVIAFVRNLDEVEARFENLAENMVRNKLSVPDICYQVSEIVKLDPSLSDDAIAQRLNRSQAYVRDLRTIFMGLQKTKAKVLVPDTKKEVPLIEAWRNSTTHLAYKDMLDIASLESADEQVAQFRTKMKYKQDGTNEDNTVRGRHAWLENAPIYAGKVAAFLAVLAKRGVVDIDEDSLFDIDNVKAMVGIIKPEYLKPKPDKEGNESRTEEQWASVAGAAEKAFKEAKRAKESGKIPPAPKSSGKDVAKNGRAAARA